MHTYSTMDQALGERTVVITKSLKIAKALEH
jgi:hypothetical protein